MVVGKPGGLTVAEVLACGRPLLATRALGGQEGFNVRFLERHGVGRLVPEEALVRGLGDMLHRELVSTDEVADLLLDVRSLLTIAEPVAN